jgi:HD-like signal output (HDOD) protein
MNRPTHFAAASHPRRTGVVGVSAGRISAGSAAGVVTSSHLFVPSMDHAMNAGGSGTKPRAAGPGKPAPDLVGATLGNYRVAGLLGKGGMGSVYLAEHMLIGRKVAIKVLDPAIAEEADAVSRFFVEARAVNEIRHPNIVEVTDLGTHKGQPFIVMEFLGGATLEHRLIEKQRLSLAETVHVVRQMASALGAAHERGLVHRDLKPANVMLLNHPDYPDFVKVLDFGIAKLLGVAPTAQHRTETGTLLGTPAFMSPEQCLGDVQLDHRSDIYSLGVMTFQMLAGRLPFTAEAVGRLILGHVHEPPPKLTELRPELPEAVAQVVDRALAKKPHDRFPSMRELRRELEVACGRPRSLTPVLAVVSAPAAPVAPPAKATVPGRTSALAATLPRTPAPQAATPTPVVTTLPELLRERVRKMDLAFPELPELSRQCLDMLRDPGYSFAAVAALVRRDGRLASHVVRRANGDGMTGKAAATNPEQAMGRLGSGWLGVTIIELAARRALELRDPRFEDIFRRPWQHALAAAMAGDRLARALGLEARAADVYLAALLRDAGVSLLAQLIPELERELAGRRPPRPTPVETVVEQVNLHRRAVSAALLRRWQLPDEMVAAVEASTVDSAGGWSLANLVRTAGAIGDREGFYLRREALEEAEITLDVAMRDLGLTELRTKRVTDRLKEAVRARE